MRRALPTPNGCARRIVLRRALHVGASLALACTMPRCAIAAPIKLDKTPGPLG